MAVNTQPHIHTLVMCANMFVKNGNSILMMRRSLEKTYLPGFLQPIGGKIDMDEDPVVAAKRELKEEAGIEVKNIRLEAVVNEVIREKNDLYPTNWLIFHFSGDYQSGEVNHTEEGDLVWIDPPYLQHEKIMESVKIIMEQLFIPKHGVLFATYVWSNGSYSTEQRDQ